MYLIIVQYKGLISFWILDKLKIVMKEEGVTWQLSQHYVNITS